MGEARRAFRKLAYTKLHGAPLFLEWAPIGLLMPSARAAESVPKAMATGASGRLLTEVTPEDIDGCTLFVKNLNFATQGKELREHFAARWAVRSASVVQKRDPTQPGKALSMGYGFVEFYSAADTQQASFGALSLLFLDVHAGAVHLPGVGQGFCGDY